MIRAVRTITTLLTPRERRYVLALLPALALMALVEALGVASIMPFLALLTDSEAVFSSAPLHWLYDALGFSSSERFLFFLGLGALAALALSNAFSVFILWRVSRLTWMQNHRLSSRLMARYLARPYPFFLNRNSAELGKNILLEASQVVTGVLVPGMLLVAKGFVTLALLVLLVLVDPLLTLLVATVLGGAYLGIFVLLRRKLSALSAERVAVARARFQSISEAFGGVKEVKMMGREGAFFGRFFRPSERFSEILVTEAVVSFVPKYVLEVFAFGGILFISLYLLAQGDLAQVLPVIGVYAFASYRLMPALQQIFDALTKVRLSLASLELLHHDLHGSEAAAWEEGVFETSHAEAGLAVAHDICLERVTYSYPETPRASLQDVTLRIPARSSVALVGRTGAGKTTAVDILLGLLSPQSGALLVDGQVVAGPLLPRWRQSIGYVPQHIYLSDDSVARNIAFGLAEPDMDAVERAARTAHLHDFIQGLPEGYATLVGERGVRLSGGQRQRIGIARALYHDPAVLVLDEATSALDGLTEEGVFRALQQLSGSKTLIMIAHRMSTVRACDNVVLLEAGRITAQGSFEALLRGNAHFRALAQLQDGAELQVGALLDNVQDSILGNVRDDAQDSIQNNVQDGGVEPPAAVASGSAWRRPQKERQGA